MESTEPALSDNRAESRFEVHVGQETAGFLRYRRLDDQRLITLIHTEVGERFAGRGLAGQLAGFALDTARKEEIGVLPSCEYVQNWIKRHDDYLDLVPAERRAEFGL